MSHVQTIKKIKDYYKPVRICNFWSNSNIKYKRNGNRNKTIN